ncbi:CDP-diacylglycerol--glycerol-3-phosphate 3-phosphatidyltransferase 2 [Argentina anserina]|uniref:CDP-diacylglycerol--glycerol-3-phosphate 3-phosphatidyltransferase 2 n=1 Tax=Argentina anserina TaxID=57926 RepID=UPI00217658C2|nr:CDP-diacylglycerol--glycerol-3-phosphate 3-phosphatidyltransferase 2 [Potentilla anserina]
MTTATSPIKPLPQNLLLPNWVRPLSHLSRSSSSSTPTPHHPITTSSTPQLQIRNRNPNWWRIPPSTFLHHHHHHHFGPRFRGPSKCLPISSASPASGSSENQGEEVSGVMADMGSLNHKGHDWFDGRLHPDKSDGLLSSNHNQSSSPPPPHQSSKLLTLPTILTLGRVAAVPLLISTFYVDSWLGKTATTSIFIIAAITDWLDGYLARKMRLGSAFGAFLDPVADKLMVAATLVLLCSRPQDVNAFGQVPWLLVVPSIAIIGREITMSAVREWAASQNTKLLEAVAVNNLGKWKTATQMIALTILLATRDSSLGGSEFVVASGVVLLYISAWLAVWSLAVYMSKIWKVLLR